MAGWPRFQLDGTRVGAEIPIGERVCRHIKRKWFKNDGITLDPMAFSDHDHQSSADWLTGTVTVSERLRRGRILQDRAALEEGGIVSDDNRLIAAATFSTDFQFRLPITWDPVLDWCSNAADLRNNPYHVLVRFDTLDRKQRSEIKDRLILQIRKYGSIYRLVL
jgi:hypothetical protein